jgi:hypothetical protein
MLELTYRAINTLTPYSNNSRTHTNKQIKQIADSIEEFGFTNPILVDENDGVIAGHGRIEAAKMLNIEEVPTITLENLSDEQKAAYVIADNKLALNAGWDEDKLQLELLRLQELDFDISLTGFDLKELEKITDENKYTKKVDIPVYEPTDEKPEIGELYDIAKCQELLQQINGADISAEEKIFLTAAAYRHVSFHFENIANFYAHSNKDIQELMENSALVIIDFDKAIEQGYVRLSDKISDQYTKDYPDEG